MIKKVEWTDLKTGDLFYLEEMCMHFYTKIIPFKNSLGTQKDFMYEDSYADNKLYFYDHAHERAYYIKQ
jgi:hypothetical protein